MIELPNVTSLYVLLAFGISYWILKKYLFVPLSADPRGARARRARGAEGVRREPRDASRRRSPPGEQKLSAARREALKTREELRGEGLARCSSSKLAEARAARFRGDRARQPRDRGAGVRAPRRQLPERARASRGSSPRRSSAGSSPRELLLAPSVDRAFGRPAVLLRRRRSTREVPRAAADGSGSSSTSSSSSRCSSTSSPSR